MATVTADISATTQIIGVTDPGTPARKSLHRIEDEVVEFLDLVLSSTTVWLVNRGVLGTTAATHVATSTVTPVSLAVAIDEPA